MLREPSFKSEEVAQLRGRLHGKRQRNVIACVALVLGVASGSAAQAADHCVWLYDPQSQFPQSPGTPFGPVFVLSQKIEPLPSVYVQVYAEETGAVDCQFANPLIHPIERGRELPLWTGPPFGPAPTVSAQLIQDLWQTIPGFICIPDDPLLGVCFSGGYVKFYSGVFSPVVGGGEGIVGEGQTYTVALVWTGTW